MFKPSQFLAIALAGSIAITTALADTVTEATPPNSSNLFASYLVPSQPELPAKSYVLMDAYSGDFIAEKNSHVKIHPASLTKLMTIYIVFSELANGRIHLDDKVLISKKAWQTGGSRMFVKVGTQVSVNDLIQGEIVQSGNDATMALAEYIGGTEEGFVQMMNQQATALGLKDTHFSDATGLPAPNHLTTAHDLAIIARAIVTTYPQYYHYFSQKWFTWNGIRQPNRNRLLWRNIGVDGLKTGHTDDAGYCLISSAIQNNTRFISVMMGTNSDEARQDQSQALLMYGFRFFQSIKIYGSTDVISQQRVWKAENKYLNVGVAHDFYVTVPRTATNDLKVSVSIAPDLIAPITKGQSVGTINVYLKDKLLTTTNIVALQDDPKGGWFRRLIDSIGRFFHRLFHKTTPVETIVTGNKV